MSEITNLIFKIKEIKKLNNKYWVDSLNERKLEELKFHNDDRDTNRISNLVKGSDTYEKFYGNRKYYSVVKRSKEWINKWIEKESKDSIFLDYACGNGDIAIKAGENGAKLSIGLDISNISIENATKISNEKKLDNVIFYQGDCENTKLPDNCIDTIICSGMLHHLDLSYAFHELRRILKPGGKILAVEALDYNPFIKLYRMITPNMRTKWEAAHILSLKDINFAKRFFVVSNIKYWHVCGYIAGKFPSLFIFLNYIDYFLEKIPYLQRWSWMFSFELIKPLEDNKKLILSK